MPDEAAPPGIDFKLAAGRREIASYGTAAGSLPAPDGSVTASFDGLEVPIILDFAAFDVDTGAEIEVLLNGASLGFLDPGPNNGTAFYTFEIAPEDQLPGENVVTFAQRLNPVFLWSVSDIGIFPEADFTFRAIPELEPGQFGNLFGAATDGDGVVFATFVGTGADLLLEFDAFDVDTGAEIEVLLNGESLGFLDAGPNNGLASYSFVIPAEDTGFESVILNLLAFQQSLNPAFRWGITNISLTEIPLPDFTLDPGVAETRPFGNAFDGATDTDGVVTGLFEGTGTDLVLTFRGFDVDAGETIEVALNGVPLGTLAPGVNNGLAPYAFDVPAAQQRAGDNLLTFSNLSNSTFRWGVTDVLIDTPLEIDFDLAPGVPETRPFGNAFDGATDADGVVTGLFEGTGTDLLLTFRGFDVDAGETIEVALNGVPLGTLAPGVNNGLAPYAFDVPAAEQRAGDNLLTFSNLSSSTFRWGVTDVLIDTPLEIDFDLAPGVPETRPFGNAFDGATDADGVVTGRFKGTGGDLWLTFQGFDVDAGETVEVALNGTPLGTLDPGVNNGFAEYGFGIPAADQFAGDNLLTFSNLSSPTFRWGVTDVLIALLPPAPGVNPDAYAVTRDGALTVGATAGVLANDLGLDLSAVLVAPPANGTLALEPDGSFTYQPSAGFAGADSFLYRADNASGTGNTVEVAIIVLAAENGAPVARPDTGETAEDRVLAITALANDTDPDADPLAVAEVEASSALGARVTGSDDGRGIDYDPRDAAALQALGPGESLEDSFSYTVADGRGGTASTTVSVTVRGAAEPVALDPFYALDDLLAGDEEIAARLILGVAAGDFLGEGSTNTGQSGPIDLRGDHNGDGIDDLILGAPAAGRSGDRLGEAYVVFGTEGLDTGAPIQLSALDGADGFSVTGLSDANQFARLGIAVANAGDTDGDLIDDLILGDDFQSTDLGVNTGQAYVLNGGQEFGPAFDLSTLGPGIGEALQGFTSNGGFGQSVAGAGDLNADGFADVVYGGPTASDGNTDPNGFARTLAGAAQVYFGGADGLTPGPVFWGSGGDNAGWQVEGAGDFNGDGLDDLAVASFAADANGLTDAGAVTVVFGSPQFDLFEETATGTDLEAFGLPQASGIAGLVIEGATAGERLGTDVSAAGDVNGDGLADLIIGTRNTDRAFVVFGTAEPVTTIDVSTLDGTDGFVITNDNARSDFFGNFVAGGGDFNGDGFDDLAIGAWAGDPAGNTNAGEVTVIFGGQDFGPVLDTADLDGANGFTVGGRTVGGLLGAGIGFGGDLNDDGFDDVVVAAPRVTGAGGNFTGEAAILFGTGVLADSNATPRAAPDAYALEEDGGISVSADDGVLDNDTDADGDALTAVLTSGPANGTLDLGPDGAFDYTPDPGFSGEDAFFYRASDGRAEGNAVRVSLSVGAINDAPVAVDDRFNLQPGQGLDISSGFFLAEDGVFTFPGGGGILRNDTDPDGDPLTAVLLGDVANGTLVLEADGGFSYEPAPGFTGEDSFAYAAFDGTVQSAPATVTLDVLAPNSAPDAVDDVAVIDEDTNGFADVLANDTDPDGDDLEIGGVIVPPGFPAGLGVLVDSVNDRFEIRPEFATELQTLGAGDTRVVTFDYFATDGRAGLDRASVTLTIEGRNDPAQITGITSGRVSEDGTTTVSGDLDVTDVDAGEAAFVAATGLSGAFGSLSIAADGAWTYVLNNALSTVQALDTGQFLTDTVTVQTLDGTTQQLSIRIDGVSDGGGFLGKTLEYQYLYPTIERPWNGQDVPFNASAIFVAGAGIEIEEPPASGLDWTVDVENGFIEIHYLSAISWTALDEHITFNGLRIGDGLNNLRDIVGVSSVETGQINGDLTTVTFDQNNVFINWGGQVFAAGATVRVDVSFAATGNDPIVLDLGGDGFAFRARVAFDLDDDGTAEEIGWVGPGDGLLAVDLDGSGAIESGREVISERFDGTAWESSLDALSSLDANFDGRLDSADPAFADILVWTDDGDGVSQSAELETLSDLGIASLDLATELAEDEIDGQTVFAYGQAEKTDAAPVAWAAVAFAPPAPQETGTAQADSWSDFTG